MRFGQIVPFPAARTLFRAVESFFKCVSFLFVGSNAFSQLVDFFFMISLSVVVVFLCHKALL